MVSRPVDNSGKDGTEKSAVKKSRVAKKASPTTGGASSKRVGDKKESSRAPLKKSEKKTASSARSQTSSVKNVRDFHLFLDDSVSHEQSVLSRDRSLLDHLVFAVFLENGSFAQARRAFMEIMHNFVDWNEVRVAKASEIAAVVGDLPNAVVVGERLRRLLQWIFDKTYDFDLEPMRRQSEKDVLEFLTSIPYATRFMLDYVRLFAFGGAELPLNEGSLRVLRLLGFVKVVNGEEFLDSRDVQLNEEETFQFFFQLHELGFKIMNEAEKDAALKLLKAFDKNVSKRGFDPLEPPRNTDPLEIARRLAKEQKDFSSAAASSRMYAESAGSELEDDTDDYEMESDRVNDSQEVDETVLSDGETNYRMEEATGGGLKESRPNRPQSETASFKSEAMETDLFVAVGGGSEGVDRAKIVKRSTKSSKQEAKQSPETKGSSASRRALAASASEVPKKSGASKKSSPVSSALNAEVKSSTPRRRATVDSSNVAASEPPDESRKAKGRVGKISVKSKTDVGKESEKSAKRSKTNGSDSEKGASKLKEIQQKKPR